MNTQTLDNTTYGVQDIELIENIVVIKEQVYSFLDNQNSEKITDIENEKWICPWDNIHGDLISFK